MFHWNNWTTLFLYLSYQLNVLFFTKCGWYFRLYFKNANIYGADIDKNILNNKIVQDMTANIKKSLGNTGRILIRASGTEDMIRIMVESTNQKKVNEITDKLENLIVEQDKIEKNK